MGTVFHQPQEGQHLTKKCRQKIEVKMADSMSKMGTSSYKEISITKSKSQRKMERAMATQAETLEWHKKRWGQRSSNLLLPPFPCPAFSSLAMMEDSFSEWVLISESFKEKAGQGKGGRRRLEE